MFSKHLFKKLAFFNIKLNTEPMERCYWGADQCLERTTNKQINEQFAYKKCSAVQENYRRMEDCLAAQVIILIAIRVEV